MILVDTSVWIDHLRKSDAELENLLEHGSVLSHPYVIGELALGSIPKRNVFLDAMGDLPKATMAEDDEVLRFISDYSLFGLGVGYVDVHLLAAVKLTAGASLWTRDKQLLRVAQKLRLNSNF
ncbi:MAG: PIN domain-containing protein [Candidatus Korobacteraceae bacterium]|jgi:predicted nucleic acid-binding protein